MDCSPPGSSVHGISQARILEWIAVFHTKEQMMDRLVLEQFMICMPLECQVLLKD